MGSAPPYVSYATMTEAVVPAAAWPEVYASLQALKGHVQEYPGCQHLEVFVRAEPEGAVLIQGYTIWDTAVQLEAFLERGYTFERMLADVVGLDPERSLAMEKVF